MDTIKVDGASIEFSGWERAVRGVVPDISPPNVVQTDMMLGMAKKVGTGLIACAPSRGFSRTNPAIPRVDMAAMLGNRLGTANANGQASASEIGFAMLSNLSLAIGFQQAKIKITDRQRRQWESSYPGMSIDRLLAKVAAMAVANEEDADMLASVFKASVWTENYTPGSTGCPAKWNTASADVVAQLSYARNQVGLGCGAEPNHLVLPKLVADALLSNPRLLRGMKGGRGSDQTNQNPMYADLQEVLKVEKMTIVDRRWNVAATTLATASYEYVASDGVLYFVDDGTGPETESAFVRAYYDNMVEGAGGVGIISNHNDEDDYTFWKVRREASVQILNTKSAAYWTDVL